MPEIAPPLIGTSRPAADVRARPMMCLALAAMLMIRHERHPSKELLFASTSVILLTCESLSAANLCSLANNISCVAKDEVLCQLSRETRLVCPKTCELCAGGGCKDGDASVLSRRVNEACDKKEYPCCPALTATSSDHARRHLEACDTLGPPKLGATSSVFKLAACSSFEGAPQCEHGDWRKGGVSRKSSVCCGTNRVCAYRKKA